MRTGMHVASIDRNERMQRIIKLLAERGGVGATTVELSSLDRDQSVSTTISAIRKQLRERGLGDIECKFVETNAAGRKVYVYRIQYTGQGA